ncbi:hypothetical protein VTL71DRAFT_3441 [Oculimacula yallundae]|uniref:Uncharacterized protein n=1 Tax=Oculimacula yallundae TaxID=86028 RepID=A0ABR4C759_9HELO
MAENSEIPEIRKHIGWSSVGRVAISHGDVLEEMIGHDFVPLTATSKVLIFEKYDHYLKKSAGEPSDMIHVMKEEDSMNISLLGSLSCHVSSAQDASKTTTSGHASSTNKTVFGPQFRISRPQAGFRVTNLVLKAATTNHSLMSRRSVSSSLPRHKQQMSQHARNLRRTSPPRPSSCRLVLAYNIVDHHNALNVHKAVNPAISLKGADLQAKGTNFPRPLDTFNEGDNEDDNLDVDLRGRNVKREGGFGKMAASRIDEASSSR